MNNVTIIGNIAEPKFRITNSGTSLITFGLAVNRTVNGEKQTSWINVKAWGELADNLAGSAVKGSRLIVTGYMEQESYDDKEGNKRTGVVLVAQDAGLALRFANDQNT
jgi:single-strand DNA-binding protein